MKAQEKINHLMYMDDIKLFTKNWKELEILIQYNKNISEYRNRIWHRKMCQADNEKQKKIDSSNKTTKSRKDPNVPWKKTYKYFGVWRWKNKLKTNTPELENYTKPNYIAEISSKR